MSLEIPTNDKIFKKKSITLQEGLTILVGCNGAGKSTFLSMIDNYCHKQNIPIYTYDNYTEGGLKAFENYIATGDFRGAATSKASSEGENIVYNLSNKCKTIGAFIRNNKEHHTIVITIDAIDSGLSINNIIEVKHFFHTVIADCKKSNIAIYIVVAANAFETVTEENCLNIQKGTYLTFTEYNEYKNFILETDKVVAARYEETT